MQKIVAILEKNVEWIALGLGGAFFGWMLWSYIFMSPVAKNINGHELNPSTVDAWILENKAGELDRTMSNPLPAPTLTVAPFSSIVDDSLQLKRAAPAGPLTVMIDVQPAQVSADAGVNNVPGQPLVGGPQIAALPDLPPAKPVMVLSGQSTIIPPIPGTVAAVPAPANPPAAGAPSATPHEDVHWNTVVFDIPMDELSNQWKLAFGPPAQQPNGPWKLLDAQKMTKFLMVTAYRSELSPGGAWSPEVPVDRLQNNPPQPYPLPNQPHNQATYDAWAGSHVPDLTTPPFFALAPAPCGTIWKDPSTILASLLAPPPPPVPAAPAAAQSVIGETGDNPTPNSPAAPAAPAGPPVPLFTDPTVKAEKVLPTVLPVVPPANPFNPVDQKTDLMVYLHDASIKPGHTYRYTLEYKLRNPVFNFAPQRLANAAWANQFDLTSKHSDPTQPVTVELQTSFFCSANGNKGNKTFQFDVYTWAAGIWQMHQFVVAPGDAIGNVVDNVNYATGYTFVDGKSRQTQYYATVVDDDGATSIRRADIDATSAEHKKRDSWVAQAKSPVATGGGGAPGTNPKAPVDDSKGDEDK